MSSIDLNIIQRGVSADFNWSEEHDRITAADLAKIGEQRTDNSGALNALPTPFARFYVFKEAFRRVLEQKNDPKKVAGRAYEQLVSNTLDVFEILFNLKYHENHWNNRHIVIHEWNYDENIKSLKANVPILGKAVESYYNNDLGEEKKLYFIMLEENGREYLLATSSPMTGFITPPDMDLKMVRERGNDVAKFVGKMYSPLEAVPLKRKGAKYYFKDIVLFENRSAEFKNYMYNKLFSRGSQIDSKYTVLRDYIQAFASDTDITNNWACKLDKIITGESNDLVINGIQLYSSQALDVVNYFSETIIKLPYRIAEDKFESLRYAQHHAAEYDYLLPLSREAIENMGTDSFICTCRERSSGDVVVTLECRGNKYEKEYSVSNGGVAGRGYIFDVKTAAINFDICLFPNVLSTKPEENNYFKVLVAANDKNEYKYFSVNDINLSFYNKGADGDYTLIEEATDGNFQLGVKPAVVRSQQDTASAALCGTKYYEVFNMPFYAVCAEIQLEGKSFTFALFPKWDEATQTEKSFSYAIDLGTSNTYISRRERNHFTEPQQLTMNIPMVSYLHGREVSAQKSLLSCWEEKTPAEFKTQFKTEFVPAFIDGSTYKFPIRTALCFTGEDTRKPVLFDNSNIAFFYEKMRSAINQRVITNIKWAEDSKNLRVFIRELLLLIKADILQENGMISGTELIWFRPLSFKETIKRNFEQIWAEEANYILRIEDTEHQLHCYTESEAPYYYFDTKGEYQSVASVAIMDIGGGSTDFVYFANGEAQVANSVHFGCDTIWGNGYDKMYNSRKNGIYNHYKDCLEFSSDELKALNESMKSSADSSTQDIINFWISNDQDTEISRKMREAHSAPFVYHYTAIVYYMASMFKAYNLAYPRTITFSGNGSKYIDNYITSDKAILTEITERIVGAVYGIEINDIQLVLPSFRKESTCYGGLYHKQDAKQPKPIVYLGNAKNTDYNKVIDISSAYQNGMKSDIRKEIENMNAIFKDVLEILIQKAVITGVNANKMYEVVSEGVEDALASKFQSEVVNVYEMQEPFNDTLFFLPVVDAILKLTNEYKR